METDFIYLDGLKVSKSFDEERVSDILSHGNYSVTFVNPYSYYISKKDIDFTKSLECFDCILPDGIGLVIGAKIIGTPVSERYSFDNTSLAPVVFEKCSDLNVKVAFVGGAPGVVEKFVNKLTYSFPNLNVSYISHGYHSNWECVFKELIESGSKCVVVGMGSPYQERFVIELRRYGWVGVAFTCGGFFDQYVKSENYYPYWVDRLNIRFVYRLMKEPRRLWKRYLLEYRDFVKMVIKKRFAE